MPFPTGVETVNVSSGEPITLPDGTIVRGHIRFVAPDLMVAPSDDYTLGGEAVAELIDGEFSIDLVPQDATGIDPTGWTYQILGEFVNAPNWSTFATLTKDSPSVILSDIIQPSAVDPNFESSLLPLSGGTLTGPLLLEYNSISSDVGHDLTLALSTGIMHQSGPIVAASPTSITIPMGIATFVGSFHDHSDPSTNTVEFGPETVELDDPSDPLTYFMVSSAGAIVQNAGVPTRKQRREFAILGRVVVLGGAIVSVQNSPILVAQPLGTTLDIIDSLSDIRTSGIIVTPIVDTLMFDVSVGEILNLGANSQVDLADPNVSPFNAQSPAQFRYVTQNDSVDISTRTLVDPTIYDVGGTVTAVPGGSNTTTIQRVHCFPTQNIFVQLGQNTYGSLTEALNALSIGETGPNPFVTHPDLVGGGVRTAFIIATKSSASLSDTSTARISRATRLGDPGGV